MLPVGCCHATELHLLLRDTCHITAQHGAYYYQEQCSLSQYYSFKSSRTEQPASAVRTDTQTPGQTKIFHALCQACAHKGSVVAVTGTQSWKTTLKMAA